jgi:uroporphyrin-III C-methyltransferase
MSYILNILKVIIRKGTPALKQITGLLDQIPNLTNRLKILSSPGFKYKGNEPGKVTLVGFGPGNPDLLTLGGDKALAQSDIIFHDDLLDIDYLKKYRAEKVYVGKRKGNHRVEQNEINRLLLDAAKAGKKVVRLKGGDPMIFAHGGEEVEYLERNLIPVEVIPGVSAGVAVSSLLKVPLTHRGISSSVAFISGHSKNISLPDADTLVIYMGGSNIRTIARNAIAQGRDQDIPVMLVHNLSLPGQQEFFFTLGELALNEQNFPTPIIIVIGEVVSFRNCSAFDSSWNNRRVSLSTISRYTNLDKEKSLEQLIYTNLQKVNAFNEAMENQRRERRPVAAIKLTAAGKKTKEAHKEYES